MLGLFNTPTGLAANQQIFLPPGSAVWQTWVKPKGITFIHFIALSGGGGGGSGHSRAAGGDGGGGGGGACSGITTFLTPALTIPDVLYIMVGIGGQGGNGGGAGNAGTAGGQTYISFSKDLSVPNLLLVSNTSNGPGGGGKGTAGAQGSAGAVPGTPSININHRFGNWNTIGGIAGQPGGAQTGANGSPVSAWGGALPLSPGAGGGGSTGTDFNGGAVNASADVDFTILVKAAANALVSGGTGGNTSANAGGSGVQLWKPFFMTGGSGGGTNDGGVAGNGGNGGIGCGGGGGGAGTTGGKGGNGGPGIVIVLSW